MNTPIALPRGGNCRIQGTIESIRLDNLNYTLSRNKQWYKEYYIAGMSQ